MKPLLSAAALAAAVFVCAGARASEDYGGFASLGYTDLHYKEPRSYGGNAYTSGGWHLGAGLRAAPGFEFRADYSSGSTEAEVCGVGAGGCFSSSFKPRAHELRAGLFFAPVPGGFVGYRLGGGYEDFELSGKIPNGATQLDSESERGPFLQGALVFNISNSFELDGLVSRLQLADQGGAKDQGWEYGAVAQFHAMVADVQLDYRNSNLNAEAYPGAHKELRTYGLSVVIPWGYPERKFGPLPPLKKRVPKKKSE